MVLSYAVQKSKFDWPLTEIIDIIQPTKPEKNSTSERKENRTEILCQKGDWGGMKTYVSGKGA